MSDHENTAESPAALSDEQAHTILSRAHIPFIAIDESGLILEWNLQAEVTLGWARADVIGTPLAHTIIPERYRLAHLAGLKRFKASGTGNFVNRRIEIYAQRRDGSEIPVELAIFPVQEGQRQIFCAFIYDLTARDADKIQLAKQTKQLRLTETHLSAALSCMADGLYQTDAEGLLTYLNPAGEQILGYKFEDLCGQNIHELIHSRFPQGKKRPAGNCWLQAPMKTGTVYQEKEDYFIHRDGAFVAVQCSRAPLIVDGISQGFVVCFRNIADRKARERRLAAEESMIEALAASESEQAGLLEVLETICDYCDWDVAGFWEVCKEENVLRLTVTGYRHRSQTMTVQITNQSLSLKPNIGIIGRVWATKKPIWIPDLSQEETLLSKAAGARSKFAGAFGFPVIVSGEVVSVIHFLSKKDRSPDDETLQMFGRIGSHIGQFVARKRAEEHIRRQTAELIRSNAELQQFACVVSHDLQQPLSVIASHADLLAECHSERLGFEALDSLKYISDSVDRMQKLIKDLLLYARSGTPGREFQTVDLNELLKDVLANLQVAVNENKATVTCDPLPAVLGDRTQLFQLFQNLIHNGLKFRRIVKPQVRISVENDGKHYVFTVKDNGIGFDMKDSQRIFAPFERSHSKTKFPGTGIGLSICKKIVEAHAGTIWAEATPGAGAAFHFTLPCPPPPP